MKRSVLRYLFCIRNELPSKVAEEKVHPPPSMTTAKHDHIYCSMALRQPKKGNKRSPKKSGKQIESIYVVNDDHDPPIYSVSTKIPLKIDVSTQTESLNPCTCNIALI